MNLNPSLGPSCMPREETNGQMTRTSTLASSTMEKLEHLIDGLLVVGCIQKAIYLGWESSRSSARQSKLDRSTGRYDG